MSSSDLIAGIVAFLFTFAILSYLIGDNPGFRIAIYIFVGISSGYVAAVAFWQILWPDLVVPLISGTGMQKALLAVPILLIGMLLMKAWPSLSRLGMPALGLLVGVSSAVAIGGAVNGTLLPQMNATIAPFDPNNFTKADALPNAVVALVGVITTLAYFHFGARTRGDGSVRRIGLIELLAFIGSFFLAVTLGVLFAGVYTAALTALIERLHFIGTFFGLG